MAAVNVLAVLKTYLLHLMQPNSMGSPSPSLGTELFSLPNFSCIALPSSLAYHSPKTASSELKANMAGEARQCCERHHGPRIVLKTTRPRSNRESRNGYIRLDVPYLQTVSLPIHPSSPAQSQGSYNRSSHNTIVPFSRFNPPPQI